MQLFDMVNMTITNTERKGTNITIIIDKEKNKGIEIFLGFRQLYADFRVYCIHKDFAKSEQSMLELSKDILSNYPEAVIHITRLINFTKLSVARKLAFSELFKRETPKNVIKELDRKVMNAIGRCIT